MSLQSAFRAGFVRRWHTNPDLAHTCDRIDGHAGRVARIIIMLHPNPSFDLIRAALIHDDGESETGDLSATFKDRISVECMWQINDAESKAAEMIWGDALGYRITGSDLEWLRFADRLDAFMWARHHAPHVLDGVGWPEARLWLEITSIELECADAPEFQGVLS